MLGVAVGVCMQQRQFYFFTLGCSNKKKKASNPTQCTASNKEQELRFLLQNPQTTRPRTTTNENNKTTEDPLRLLGLNCAALLFLPLRRPPPNCGDNDRCATSWTAQIAGRASPRLSREETDERKRSKINTKKWVSLFYGSSFIVCLPAARSGRSSGVKGPW